MLFFERNLPYYAAHRDFDQRPGGRLEFYEEWQIINHFARRQLSDADAAMVTSVVRPRGAEHDNRPGFDRLGIE